MTDTGDVRPKLSRRDVLKVLGAGVGVGVVAGAAAAVGVDLYNRPNYSIPTEGKEIPQEWLAGEIPFKTLDLVNNPDYFIGEQGIKFTQSLGFTIHNEYKNFKNEAYEDNDSSGWQNENMQRSIDGLISKTASLASDLVFARENGFNNLAQELKEKYTEVASYTQMVSRLIGYKNEIGNKPFLTALEHSFGDETIGTLKYGDVEKAIDRKNINTVWNYDWKAYTKGQPVLSPVPMSFFSLDGFEMTYKPFIYKGDPYLLPDKAKPPINASHERFTKRPAKVELLNFNEEVSLKIKKELGKLGIERGINQVMLTEDPVGMWAQTRTSDKTSEVELFRPEISELDLDRYKSEEKAILHVLVHEGYHSINSRRTYLNRYDQLQMRSLEQDILVTSDPLLNLKTLFNPEGDDHGYYPDNETSMTRYYVENLLDAYGGIGDSVSQYSDEFRAGVALLTGEDIYSNLWMNETDQDLPGLFQRLSKDIESYDGVTRIIAQTIIDHKESIEAKKRSFYPRESTFDPEYYTQQVIPLIISHLVIYRSDELKSSLKPENLEIDRGLNINFLDSLQKRLTNFTRSTCSEEFLSEIFAQAMLTEKYGEHPVDFVNKAKPKFDKILTILRKNNLVKQPNTI